MSEKMLTGALEITNRMGVSEATFMDLVHNHGLPATKKSNQFEMSVADLVEWEKRSVKEKLEPAKAKNEQQAKPTQKFKKKTSFRR